MIVCHCYKVTSKQLSDCISKGLVSLDDVKKACKAGTGCGNCLPAVEQYLIVQLKKKTYESVR